MAVGSRFEKHPSFTWRDSLRGATIFAVVVSPLAGLLVWGVNRMTGAGFRLGRGKSIYYDPQFDHTKAKAEEVVDGGHRDGA